MGNAFLYTYKQTPAKMKPSLCFQIQITQNEARQAELLNKLKPPAEALLQSFQHTRLQPGSPSLSTAGTRIRKKK
jgi:hypothetical protein